MSPPCRHQRTANVVLFTGQRVARICLECDADLPPWALRDDPPPPTAFTKPARVRLHWPSPVLLNCVKSPSR